MGSQVNCGSIVLMFKKQSPVRNKTKPKPRRLVIDPSKRMLLKQLALGIGLFAVASLLLTGVWYGTRIESLTLTKITASGGETIDANRVVIVAAEPLQGTYMGIIPRTFAWFYPREEVYAALKTIPRMKDPQINRVSGTQLALSYDEYVPYALWCDEVETDQCLLFDDTGYAFGEAPRLTGGAFIRYRTLGVQPTVGQTIAPTEHLDHIKTFIDLLKKGNRFEIAAVETDTAGDVFYIVSSGGEFKASLRDDPHKVYDNLITIIADKNFTDIKPGAFQYIDLRFGNKVYVKKEETLASTSASTTTELSQ